MFFLGSEGFFFVGWQGGWLVGGEETKSLRVAGGFLFLLSRNSVVPKMFYRALSFRIRKFVG